jgi:cellobiose-specific phosphotransferase system component IIB
MKVLLSVIALSLSTWGVPSALAQPAGCTTYLQGVERIAKTAKKSGFKAAVARLNESDTIEFYRNADVLGMTPEDGFQATTLAFVINDQSENVAVLYYDANGCAADGEIISDMIFLYLMTETFGQNIPEFTRIKIGLQA